MCPRAVSLLLLESKKRNAIHISDRNNTANVKDSLPSPDGSVADLLLSFFLSVELLYSGMSQLKYGVKYRKSSIFK